MVVWMTKERNREKEMMSWTKSLEALIEKVNTKRDPELVKLLKLIEKSCQMRKKIQELGIWLE